MYRSCKKILEINEEKVNNFLLNQENNTHIILLYGEFYNEFGKYDINEIDFNKILNKFKNKSNLYSEKKVLYLHYLNIIMENEITPHNNSNMTVIKNRKYYEVYNDINNSLNLKNIFMYSVKEVILTDIFKFPFIQKYHNNHTDDIFIFKHNDSIDIHFIKSLDNVENILTYSINIYINDNNDINNNDLINVFDSLADCIY